MKRHLLAAAAALALAACADGGPTSVREPAERAASIGGATAQSGQYSIFTSQTPTTTVDVSPSGYELGTEFHVTSNGCVIGMRFWRASGETGTNTLKLWASNGTQLASKTVTTSGSGWQYAYLSGFACLSTYTPYRVSVNVNSKAVKSSGFFQNGYLVNQPLVATSGYYGTKGSRPTTAHNDAYFVDVILDTDIIY